MRFSRMAEELAELARLEADRVAGFELALEAARKRLAAIQAAHDNIVLLLNGEQPGDAVELPPELVTVRANTPLVLPKTRPSPKPKHDGRKAGTKRPLMVLRGGFEDALVAYAQRQPDGVFNYKDCAEHLERSGIVGHSARSSMSRRVSARLSASTSPYERVGPGMWRWTGFAEWQELQLGRR